LALARVASEDSFIALDDAAPEVVLSEDTIEAAAIKLTQVSR
jgi:2-oxoisovalerate dehydrogenase E1 component